MSSRHHNAICSPTYSLTHSLPPSSYLCIYWWSIRCQTPVLSTGEWKDLRYVKPGRVVPTPWFCSHASSMDPFTRRRHTNILDAQFQGFHRPSLSLFMNLLASKAKDTWSCNVSLQITFPLGSWLEPDSYVICLVSYTIWVNFLTSVF